MQNRGIIRKLKIFDKRRNKAELINTERKLVIQISFDFINLIKFMNLSPSDSSEYWTYNLFHLVSLIWTPRLISIFSNWTSERDPSLSLSNELKNDQKALILLNIDISSILYTSKVMASQPFCSEILAAWLTNRYIYGHLTFKFSLSAYFFAFFGSTFTPIQG